jgi:hypothetical protein
VVDLFRAIIKVEERNKSVPVLPVLTEQFVLYGIEELKLKQLMIQTIFSIKKG